jgi:putative transposase
MRKFFRDNNFELSMSRRGNCHDNVVAESFFSLLRTECIKGKIYKTRSEAKAEIFNYIKLFYNPSRRHNNNDGVSQIEFEKQYYQKLSSL